MRKTIIFTVILAGIVSVNACNKNETTATTPSLQGLLINEAIPYVAPGTEQVFKANTSYISTSDASKSGPVGIIWQVNNAAKDTLSRNYLLENPEFKYKADTLGYYTIACYAFADGYYNSSTVTNFRAINPATALTGVASAASVNIDGKEWTASNLYNPDFGVSYKQATVTDTVFGRFYTWEEASEACPAGWHLPSADEWDALGDTSWRLMAPAKFLDDEMWEPALGQEITNEIGFNAIPVGYLDNAASVEKYRRYGQMAAFWTASDSDSDSSLAQFRFIIYDTPVIMKGNGSKTSLALSVRCVKD